MLRTLPLALVAAGIAVLSGNVCGDTLTLRNGEKIEGKITAETKTEITIEAKVSASIIDSRTIRRSEVLSVAKDAPDEGAWQPLRNLTPGANSLPLVSYDAAINQLQGFIAQFPQSAHTVEAKKIAEAFSADKKRVETGEVKLEGKWLSKNAPKESYQTNALLAFNHMKGQSTADPAGALKTFDAIERSFPGSRIYPETIELAKSILDARLTKLTSQEQAAHGEMIKHVKDLDRFLRQAEQRGDSQRQATAQQREALLRASDQERDNLRALGDRVHREKTAIDRLDNLPTSRMRGSLQAVDRAKAAIENKNFAAAEKELQEAAKLWGANELVARLREDLQTARTIAATAPPSEPIAPTPAEATPPKDAPVVAALEPPASATIADQSEADPEKPFLLTRAGMITVIIGVFFLIAVVNARKKGS